MPKVDQPVQDEFAAKVALFDQIETDRMAFREKSELLLQSLLAQAFTGELTAAWREQHKDELAIAATERDRLLGAAFSVELDHSIVVGKPIEIHHAPPLSVPGRQQIVAALSDDQRKVLRLALAAEGRFTADTLDQANAIDPVTIERALRVLAAAGLVMPLSLQATSSDDTPFFFCAYRALDPSDHALIEDATE
jgi:type I restriction enzyme S subunit